MSAARGAWLSWLEYLRGLGLGGTWPHRNNEWHILIATYRQGTLFTSLTFSDRFPHALPSPRGIQFRGPWGEHERRRTPGPLVIALLYRRRHPHMRTNHGCLMINSYVGKSTLEMLGKRQLLRVRGCVPLQAGSTRWAMLLGRDTRHGCYSFGGQSRQARQSRGDGGDAPTSSIGCLPSTYIRVGKIPAGYISLNTPRRVVSP